MASSNKYPTLSPTPRRSLIIIAARHRDKAGTVTTPVRTNLRSFIIHTDTIVGCGSSEYYNSISTGQN